MKLPKAAILPIMGEADRVGAGSCVRLIVGIGLLDRSLLPSVAGCRSGGCPSPRTAGGNGPRGPTGCACRDASGARQVKGLGKPSGDSRRPLAAASLGASHFGRDDSRDSPWVLLCEGGDARTTPRRCKLLAVGITRVWLGATVVIPVGVNERASARSTGRSPLTATLSRGRTGTGETPRPLCC